jgi:hypothetical protein
MWISNGTLQGTTRLTNPPLPTSGPFVPLGERIVFTRTLPQTGREPWVLQDGAPSTTTSTTTLAVPTTLASASTTTSTTTTMPNPSTPLSTSTTTIVAPPPAFEALRGSVLALRTGRRRSGQQMLFVSRDSALSLGQGNGTTDDPVEHGGSLRIRSGAGQFERTYLLPPERWRYVGRRGAQHGYRLREAGPIRSLVVLPGTRLELHARGRDLGIELDTNPDPVLIELRLGSQAYCASLGGDVTFKASRRYLAHDAPAPATCSP